MSAATPVPSVVLNLSLVLAGSMIGAALVLWVRRRPPAPRPLWRAGAVGLIVSLLFLSLPGSSLAAAGSAQFQDISQGDCTQFAADDSASASLSVFGLDLGPAFAFDESETADGRWHVDAAVGAAGGITLSLGQTLGEFGAALDVSTSSHVTLTITNSYDFATRGEADSYVRRAASLFLSDIAAIPGTSRMLGTLSAGNNTPVEPALVPPSATAVDLAGDVAIDAQLGTQVFQLSVDLSGAASVSLMAPPGPQSADEWFVTDPANVEIGLHLNAALDADAVAALEFNGEAELTLGFTKESVGPADVWIPQSVGLTATAELSSAAQAAPTLDSIGSLLSGQPGTGSVQERDLAASAFLRLLGVNLSENEGLSVKVDMLAEGAGSHPRTFAALTEFMAAAGPAFAGKAADIRAVERAANDLATALAEEADVGVKGYLVSQAKGSIDVSVGDVVTFGGSAQVSASQDELIAALYRVSGGQLAASATCTPLERPLS
jgi:hypothetical protein